MAKMKVKTAFLHEGRNYKIGDLIEVSSRSDQQHLLRTGQAEMETLNFFKEEKKVIQTKELKIEKETKEEVSEIDSLRERYLDKFDKEADKRWKESRLIDELEND
jgi:uncharacterized protein YnzC (UPF0291/DUF896 family)|tara:strand:+ start:4420 stop:4734 length:315 start_codon:yes stop_codon:yes gene_type:complete